MKTTKILFSILLISAATLFLSCKKKDKSPSTETATTTAAPVEQYNSVTFTLVAFDATGNATSFNGPVKAYVGSDSILVAVTTATAKPSANCDYFQAPVQMTVKTFQLKKGENTDIKFKDNSGLLGTFTVVDSGNSYSTAQAPNHPTLQLLMCSANSRQFALQW